MGSPHSRRRKPPKKMGIQYPNNIIDSSGGRTDTPMTRDDRELPLLSPNLPEQSLNGKEATDADKPCNLRRTPSSRYYIRVPMFSIHEYLKIQQNALPVGKSFDRDLHITNWRNACDEYERIKQADWPLRYADRPRIEEIPTEMQTMSDELVNSAFFKRAFSHTSHTVKMVDLRRIIGWQNDVDADCVDRHTEALTQGLTPEELFRFCLSMDSRTPDVKWNQVQDGYTFTSASNDLRALDNGLVPPECISTLDPYGHVTHAVAITVGYTSNYVTVVQMANRLYLSNGYHRAVSLIKSGIHMAPVVILTNERQQEIATTMPVQILQNFGLYIDKQLQRPPILEDFTLPKIMEEIWSPPKLKRIKVKITVEEELVPLA
jgi:hypothetical protein